MTITSTTTMVGIGETTTMTTPVFAKGPSEEATTINNSSTDTSTTAVHPESLIGLRLLKEDSDTNVVTKLISATFYDDDTKVSYWNADRVHFHPATGHVQLLDLGGSRIKKISIPAFAKLGLETLNLAGTDLPIPILMEILKELSNTSSTTLETLYIGGNGLRDAGMETIFSSDMRSAGVLFSKLKKLDLRYNDIGPRGMKALVDSILPSSSSSNASSCIEKLYLEGNCIADEGTIVLADAMTKSNGRSTLQELYLGSNQIGPKGAIALSQYILSSGSQSPLHKLYLEGNHISQEGAKALEDVLNKLEGTSPLKQLFVDNNNIGKEGSEALGKALRSNTIIGDTM